MAKFGSYYNAAIVPANNDVVLIGDASNTNKVEGVHAEDLPIGTAAQSALDGKITVSTKVKRVGDAETIQSVIDTIPVMQGSLVSGITNPYIVNVPPGHEKEYYSLVQDVSDNASDKRNIKIVFENNPDNKFIVDQWDALDEIGDWTLYTGDTLTIDTSNKFEGGGCLKITGSGFIRCTKNGNFDFSAYQGMLIDIQMDISQMNYMALYLYTNTAFIGRSCGTITGTGTINRTFFFPFVQTSTDILDYSNITRVRIGLDKTGYPGVHEGYIDNIRLVRTTPHRTAVLRYDDGYASDFSVGTKRLDEYGWKGNFGIIASHVDFDAGKIALSECKKMDSSGHILCNHTYAHPSFASDGFTEQETYQDYVLGANFLRMNGFVLGEQLFVNPYSESNAFLDNFLDKDGVVSTYAKHGVMPAMEFSGNETPSAIIEAFITQKQGGIIQFIFHNPGTDETAYQTMLAWINTRFSEVITFPEILNRMPVEMHSKKHENISHTEIGFKKTLSEDLDMRNYFGKDYFLDPGGANRDITPTGKFKPFSEKRIINTADAAETLTFDPLFTSSGTADNTSDLLTFSTGAWVTNQLVGRTINNTTDGSSGVILENDDTTITAVLFGGTNNTWTTTDAFTITPVGSNQDITQGSIGLFIYDGEGWH